MTTAKKTSPKKRSCSKCGKMNAIPPARLCPTCKRASKKASKEKARETRAQNVYGLLPGDYQKLWESSNGTCFICGGKGGGRLAIDHDHRLEGGEAVRGLLCYTCNSILLARIGKDDPDRLDMLLTNAVAYLRNPPAAKILGFENSQNA